MYGVDASKKTFKLKKAYNVNASKKTEKLKKCYVVGADKKLVKVWSSETGRILWYRVPVSDYTNTNLVWSDDGYVWNQFSLPFCVTKIEYDDGYFVAVGYRAVGDGYTSNTIYVSHSKDCVTWTHKTFSTDSTSSFSSVYFGYFKGVWRLVYLYSSDGTEYGYSSTDLVTWTYSGSNVYSSNHIAIRQHRTTVVTTVGGIEYYVQTTSYNSFRYCLTSSDETKSASWTTVSLDYSPEQLIGTDSGLFIQFNNTDNSPDYSYIRKYSDAWDTYVQKSHRLYDNNARASCTVYNEDEKEILLFSITYNTSTASALMKYDSESLNLKTNSLVTFNYNTGFCPGKVIYKEDEKKYVAFPNHHVSDKTIGHSDDGITWTVGGDCGLTSVGEQIYGLVM